MCHFSKGPLNWSCRTKSGFTCVGSARMWLISFSYGTRPAVCCNQTVEMCRVCVVNQSLTVCGATGWLAPAAAGIDHRTSFTNPLYGRHCGGGGTVNEATALYFHTWNKHSVLWHFTGVVHHHIQENKVILSFKWTFSLSATKKLLCSSWYLCLTNPYLVSYLYQAMIASLTTTIFSDLNVNTLSLDIHFRPSRDRRRRRRTGGDGSLAVSAWVTVQVTRLHRVHLTWDPFFRNTKRYIHLGDILCSTTYIRRRYGQNVRSVKKDVMICFRYKQTKHMVDLIGFTWTQYNTQNSAYVLMDQL